MKSGRQRSSSIIAPVVPCSAAETNRAFTCPCPAPWPCIHCSQRPPYPPGLQVCHILPCPAAMAGPPWAASGLTPPKAAILRRRQSRDAGDTPSTRTEPIYRPRTIRAQAPSAGLPRPASPERHRPCPVVFAAVFFHTSHSFHSRNETCEILRPQREKIWTTSRLRRGLVRSFRNANGIPGRSKPASGASSKSIAPGRNRVRSKAGRLAAQKARRR